MRVSDFCSNGRCKNPTTPGKPFCSACLRKRNIQRQQQKKSLPYYMNSDPSEYMSNKASSVGRETGFINSKPSKTKNRMKLA